MANKIIWKPLLTLAVITPILTEHLSANLSGLAFLNPGIFLLLIIAGYGFPIIVIREVAVRWRLGVYGIFLLGFAYGIYNEGILAKTLLLQNNVPIPTFNDYSYYLGINFGFSLLISVWHALHAVLYPILIVYFLYPTASAIPWLGKKRHCFWQFPDCWWG